MAAKKTIKILRDFFREQEKDNAQCAIPDEELNIKEIMKKPNPGVVEAKRRGLSITVAEGDIIYKVNADNTKEKIGTVSSKDVRLTERRYSAR